MNIPNRIRVAFTICTTVHRRVHSLPSLSCQRLSSTVGQVILFYGKVSRLTRRGKEDHKHFLFRTRSSCVIIVHRPSTDFYSTILGGCSVNPQVSQMSQNEHKVVNMHDKTEYSYLAILVFLAAQRKIIKYNCLTLLSQTGSLLVYLYK